MTARVYAATTYGFEGKLIEVECDTSNSLPQLVIVGLGNKAIDEARERVRSAIKNSKLDFPRKRITINLAPANLPRDGVHFDLPIAAAILAISGQLPSRFLQDTLFTGELALDGSLRPVRGIINHMQAAQAAGLRRVIMPLANCEQASLVAGPAIVGVRSLREAFLQTTRTSVVSSSTAVSSKKSIVYSINSRQISKPPTTFSDIAGQEQAKRALIIAAAGHHNILLTGPPGAGKTMLARAVLSILPPLTNPEIIEVTQLHSLAGENSEAIITTRPFRAPHHSTSHIALLGGGARPKPGEISLAHRGVLFLDELPEYSRLSLESLRQPLEDKVITITRANERATYPADFMLVATQNPCPCGYANDPTKECQCTPTKIQQYQQKVSGPLRDRIDIVLTVASIKHRLLLENNIDDISTTNYATAVFRARQHQTRRFGTSHKTNASLSSNEISARSSLHPKSKDLLNKASDALQLSTRSYFKTIKVARTIADLADSTNILPEHIAEALQFRPDSGV